MKIGLAFPFDFAQVHLALEAPDVIWCVLIPGPINIFRPQPGSAFSTCFNWSLSGGLAGGGRDRAVGGRNNLLNKTLEWGLTWAEEDLEIFLFETEYGEGNLNMRKHARVHFRDNLAGVYSEDAVFHSYSALLQDLSPAWQTLLRGKSGGKTHISFHGEDSQPCGCLQSGVSFQHWELLSRGCWRIRLRRSGSHKQRQGHGPGVQAACGTTKYLWYLVGDSAPGGFSGWSIVGEFVKGAYE